MNLYLRMIIHPQTHDNYRIILKREDGVNPLEGSAFLAHSLCGNVWRKGHSALEPRSPQTG